MDIASSQVCNVRMQALKFVKNLKWTLIRTLCPNKSASQRNKKGEGHDRTKTISSMGK